MSKLCSCKCLVGKASVLLLLTTLLMQCTGCEYTRVENVENNVESYVSEQVVGETLPIEKVSQSDKLQYITLYNGIDVAWSNDKTYAVVNDNVPYFYDTEIIDSSYEFYSYLDELGRCGEARACIGVEIMPTEKRGKIGQVKPTGWHTIKYDCVDGKYLYNRCHLIGYQLAGENANPLNLITGTRYMNVVGMLPFENAVDDYIEDTGNHVIYRVTPVFEGDNLVAYGVLMEGYSVEDNGDGVCFNVFCYNTQPGVEIDYKTGDSWLSGEKPVNKTDDVLENNLDELDDIEIEEVVEEIYILNTNTKKFHKITCGNGLKIKEENKEEYTGARAELIEQGYEPCGQCKP